jgi:hypothetical protein
MDYETVVIETAPGVKLCVRAYKKQGISSNRALSILL